ncbi:3-hydroxybutyryl-CoA dehydratase [Desulfosarcina ovata subsp. sediminis]|uniref:3-hydroxybutyryl-CoA dehydratase n=1 Tax=Desulfosarcina ovata subsp. sediminis TaxID=885957 RepID=A0A5K7ZVB7_9BACT|nr:enoyl-CoA hydratase/isomerase family protein [Desulfosarcina ovata]BBO84183.1 3-hydroxybutyryl-CoA dehydratase [Desulfosarcina ovata subsp. sediminis]
MEYRFLKYRVEQGVGVVTIDRPPANALNSDLVEELHTAIDALTDDDAVRAAVFTAEGPFFVGGADIKMMQALKGKDLPPFIEGYTVHLQRAYNKIEAMPKPVIAAINGYAAGGGCELALACDMRFMAKGKLKIGLPEVKLGLLPGGGGLQRMPRLIGKSKAMELLFTGELVDAETALDIGLVHRIVEPERLMEETLRFAEKLAGQATLAIGIIKQCVNYGLNTNVKAGLAFDIDAQDILFKSQDGMEGIEAFVQKRPPNFAGK